MCQASARVPPVSFECLPTPETQWIPDNSTFKFLARLFPSVAVPFHRSSRNAPISLHPYQYLFSSSLALAGLASFEQLLLSGVMGWNSLQHPSCFSPDKGRGVLGECGLAPGVRGWNSASWGNWAFAHGLTVLLGGVFGSAGWGFPQDVLPGGEVRRGVQEQLYTQVMRVSLCANQRQQPLPSSVEKSSSVSSFPCVKRLKIKLSREKVSTPRASTSKLPILQSSSNSCNLIENHLLSPARIHSARTQNISYKPVDSFQRTYKIVCAHTSAPFCPQGWAPWEAGQTIKAITPQCSSQR